MAEACQMPFICYLKATQRAFMNLLGAEKEQLAVKWQIR